MAFKLRRLLNIVEMIKNLGDKDHASIVEGDMYPPRGPALSCSAPYRGQCSGSASSRAEKRTWLSFA